MNDFISKTEILKRAGWTEKRIKDFLPAPDKTAPNPKFRSAAPMKLYLEAKVIKVEQSKDFIATLKDVEKRKSSALKAKNTKQAKVLEWVNALIVDIPIIEQNDLYHKACLHYNQHRKKRAELNAERFDYWYSKHGHNEMNFNDFQEEKEELAEFQEATVRSNPLFLKRIATNYIRHQLTDYEAQLRALFGKVGKDAAYQLLKDKINNAIYQHYTFLRPDEAQHTN